MFFKLFLWKGSKREIGEWEASKDEKKIEDSGKKYSRNIWNFLKSFLRKHLSSASLKNTSSVFLIVHFIVILWNIFSLSKTWKFLSLKY